MGRQVPQVNLGQLAKEVLLDPQEQMDHQDSQEIMAFWDRLVFLVPLVELEQLEQMELKVLLVLLVTEVNQEIRVRMDFQVQLDLLVSLEIKGLKVLLEP